MVAAIATGSTTVDGWRGGGRFRTLRGMGELLAGHVHIAVDTESRRVAVATPIGLYWHLRIAPPPFDTSEPVEEAEVRRLLREHRFRARSWQVARTFA
jgi:hypothetical protein